MAYVQITTRCNMHCEHCCSRCTAKGEDMSVEVYKKALALDDEVCTIGGGEPTLHPQFWEFIGLALGHCDYTWLATNGSQTDTALALARMVKKEVLGCDLSLDEYHDPIDDRVIDAFSALPHNIRDVTQGGTKEPIRVGRYADSFGEYEEGDKRECACSDMMVKPNGDIMACGCDDAPRLGNIMDEGFDLWDAVKKKYGEDYEWSECWRNQPVIVC